MPRIYTCPQTGHPVFAQPAQSHAAIALRCAQGIAILQGLLTADHWTHEEREGLHTLIDGNRDSIIAHANAIIDGAFH